MKDSDRNRIFNRTMSQQARAFARSVRLAPGSELAVQPDQLDWAIEGVRVGYLVLKDGVARLSDDGKAYYDFVGVPAGG